MSLLFQLLNVIDGASSSLEHLSVTSGKGFFFLIFETLFLKAAIFLLDYQRQTNLSDNVVPVRGVCKCTVVNYYLAAPI